MHAEEEEEEAFALSRDESSSRRVPYEFEIGFGAMQLLVVFVYRFGRHGIKGSGCDLRGLDLIDGLRTPSSPASAIPGDNQGVLAEVVVSLGRRGRRSSLGIRDFFVVERFST